MNPRRRRIKERVERDRRWEKSMKESDEFFSRILMAIDMAKTRCETEATPQFMLEAFGTGPANNTRYVQT